MVTLKDIKPPLTVVSVDFMDEKSMEFEEVFGPSVCRDVYVFDAEEETEENPSPVVVIKTFANAQQVMFFSLENQFDGRLNLALPVVSNGDVTIRDVLIVIKTYTDTIDAEKLNEDLIKAGKVRDRRSPNEIN
jgi:hypothetical protein